MAPASNNLEVIMSRPIHAVRAFLVLSMSLASLACGEEDGAANVIATSSGPWTVYPDPFMDGRANPLVGITGTAQARALTATQTEVTLDVTGLPAGMTLGSHVHKLACDDNKAGGHYQHMEATTMPTDPAFANPMNEVWLDLVADTAGKARTVARVDWRPRAGQAKAIMVHAMPTGTGGVAGAKLACLPLVF
jgi:hypothetical protein